MPALADIPKEGFPDIKVIGAFKAAGLEVETEWLFRDALEGFYDEA